MASGQQRLPGYVSARRKAAGSTQNVQLRMRHARDAPGQTARYAGTEMRDPGAALAGWASRVPWCPRTLSVRRDLALPLVLLPLQPTWAAITPGTWPLFRAERAAATRVSRQIDQRRHQSEERLRVARDLHDVIGHNISLINVQASMGLDLIDSQPEQARAALSAIKSASKEALEELRTMRTTLLHDDDDAPRSPVPGLDRLPELIELTRAAGLTVEVEITANAPLLPAAVQLAAYRIIQESLTNVARHAGQARVTVRGTYDDADMHVEIDDDGKAPSGGGSALGPGSGTTGMRERATALGGNLSAGFRRGGGVRVSARLPVRPAS